MENNTIAQNLERHYNLTINATASWEFFSGLAGYASFILDTPNLKRVVDDEMKKREQMYREVDELDEQALHELSDAKQKLLDIIARHNLDVRIFKQYTSLIPMAHKDETILDHLKLFEEGKISISGIYSNNLERYIFDIAANLLRLGYGDDIKEFIVSNEAYARYWNQDDDNSDLQITSNIYGNFIFSNALKLRMQKEEAVKRSRKLEPWGAFEALIKIKEGRDAVSTGESTNKVMEDCLANKEYFFTVKDAVDIAFAAEDFGSLIDNRNTPERELHFLHRRELESAIATANLYLLRKLPEDESPNEYINRRARTIALQKKRQQLWKASVDKFMDRVEAFMRDYETTKERTEQKEDGVDQKWWKEDSRPIFDEANGKITLEGRKCEIEIGTNRYFLCDVVFRTIIGNWIEERTILERFIDGGNSDRRRSCYDAMVAVNKKVEQALGIKKLLQYKAARVRIRKELFETKS